MNEKGEIRIKEEKSRLPVDVRGSKTPVLKFPVDKPKPAPSDSFGYNITKIEKMIEKQVLVYCNAKR